MLREGQEHNEEVEEVIVHSNVYVLVVFLVLVGLCD